MDILLRVLLVLVSTILAQAFPGYMPPISGTATESGQMATLVTSVVDGDTIAVTLNGQKETLRIIGIDTPETVDPRKPVQCYGREAGAKMKELVLGKPVRLTADPTQADRDRYNRMLRYVFLTDGTDVGLTMIREGYAHEYTYGLPYRSQAEYRAAQQQAQTEKKGLWGEACAK